LEVQHEVADPVCICGDVYIDCCCPTEEAAPSPSAEPSATSSPTDAPTPGKTRTIVPTTAGATDTPTIIHAPPTETPAVPTATIPYTPTSDHTRTSTPVWTVPPTTVEPSVTVTPRPTDEPCECQQWICHKLGGFNRWKNYCCWTDGCIRAKIRRGDLLGRCEDHDITPVEPDDWNKEGCP